MRLMEAASIVLVLRPTDLNRNPAIAQRLLAWEGLIL
ncbi:uncharacterized protein METZ01_LOCUS479649, partial [marine metagenome]